MTLRSVDRLYELLVLTAILMFSSGLTEYPMLVLLVVMLVEQATGQLRWVPTTLDRPLLVFLAVLLASGVASPWRSRSLLVGFSFAVMALITVYPAARVIRARPEAIRSIVGIWVGGALLAAVWGILRTPATWPSGASTPALLSTALGTTMAAAIALALGAWTVWDDRWIRIGIAAGLAVLVTALELTISRGSWIAAVVGAVTMIALAPRRRASLGLLCLGSLAVATLVTSAVVPALAGWVEPQVLVRRVESIASVKANADRVAIWRAVPHMVRDHPLLGTGYGTFILAWPKYQPDPALEGKPTAHNVFLNFAAETGLLGLAAFLVVLGAGFVGLWHRMQSARGDPRTDGLWVALLAAVTAILTHQLFDATILSWHVGYGFLASLALAGTQTPRSTFVRQHPAPQALGAPDA